MTCVAFSIKFAKTNQKFAENSEFCEKIHYYSKLFTSLLSRRPGPRKLLREQVSLLEEQAGPKERALEFAVLIATCDTAFRKNPGLNAIEKKGFTGFDSVQSYFSTSVNVGHFS